MVTIKLIRDKYSGRSKGMGYIEMKTLEDASKALMLNGQKMCTKHKACNCSGFPMKVKRSEAEKNWSAMKEKAPPKIQPSTIYVCNLHPDLSRRDIIDFFESVGDVDNVEMELDERKQFKGSAYVKFRRPEYASRAALKTDGMEVLGRKISVSIPQRQGRHWRLEDEEGQENIALDPQRRGLIMRHLADSKKDAELSAMMQQVSNPGQVQSVFLARTWHVGAGTRREAADPRQREQLSGAAQHVHAGAGDGPQLGRGHPGGRAEAGRRVGGREGRVPEVRKRVALPRGQELRRKRVSNVRRPAELSSRRAGDERTVVQSPPDSGGVRLPLRCHVDISRSASTSVASPTRVEPPPSLSLLWPIQFDVFVGEFFVIDRSHRWKPMWVWGERLLGSAG